MPVKLSDIEVRVLGALIEKETTTPEQYPLSLNALTNACNQKSNRDPVMELDEAAVQATLDELSKKHLVSTRSGFGSRVAKYQHRFGNTEFSDPKFNPQELGILCVLFLRGAQTPGELRTRTDRLCTFRDVTEVETVLVQLMKRADGPFVARLAREPGKRESRYVHLFGDTTIAPSGIAPVTSSDSLADRVSELERRIRQLEDDLQRLKGSK